MHKQFYLGLLVILSACELPKRNAMGADNELIVICSGDIRIQMRSTLSAIFSDTIFTPQPEPYYKNVFINPEDFEMVKNNVNVVFGSIRSDVNDPGTRLVKSLLSDQQFKESISGENQLILTKDLFARDQMVLFISGQDYHQIMDQAEIQGNWIKSNFDELYVKRQTKHLFESARQKKLEKRLHNDYGWSMKIPWGFTIIREESENGLFWIGRDIPYRWFIVHWKEGLVTPDSISALDYFKRFPEKNLGTIRIHNYKFESEHRVIHDRTGWSYSGIWEHMKEAQGGPFLSYLFYDGISNRTYILFMMIYHPGNDKSVLLRQLDLMAQTFYVDEEKF